MATPAQEDPSPLPAAVVARMPLTVDAALDALQRELAGSIRRGEDVEQWQERLGGLIHHYLQHLPDASDFVFRVDGMLVQHGCRPWSIDRRGLVEDAPPHDLAA